MKRKMIIGVLLVLCLAGGTRRAETALPEPKVYDLSSAVPLKTTATLGTPTDIFSAVPQNEWHDINEFSYAPYRQIAAYDEELLVCLLQPKIAGPCQWLLVWDGEEYLFDAPYRTSYYEAVYTWADLDGDGQNELLVIACTGHGTDFHVESPFLFQKDEVGVTMYEAEYESVCEALTETVAPLIDHEARTLIVGATAVDIPAPLETETLRVQDHISYEYDGALTGRYLLECDRPDWALPAAIETLSARVTFSDGAFTLCELRIEG